MDTSAQRRTREATQDDANVVRAETHANVGSVLYPAGSAAAVALVRSMFEAADEFLSKGQIVYALAAYESVYQYDESAVRKKLIELGDRCVKRGPGSLSLAKSAYRRAGATEKLEALNAAAD
jgi:hypothetical protein